MYISHQYNMVCSSIEDTTSSVEPWDLITRWWVNNYCVRWRWMSRFGVEPCGWRGVHALSVKVGIGERVTISRSARFNAGGERPAVHTYALTKRPSSTSSPPDHHRDQERNEGRGRRALGGTGGHYRARSGRRSRHEATAGCRCDGANRSVDRRHRYCPFWFCAATGYDNSLHSTFLFFFSFLVLVLEQRDPVLAEILNIDFFLTLCPRDSAALIETVFYRLDVFSAVRYRLSLPFFLHILYEFVFVVFNCSGPRALNALCERFVRTHMLEPTGAANMTVLALNHMLPPTPSTTAATNNNNGNGGPQQQQQQQHRGADSDDMQLDIKPNVRMLTSAAAAANMTMGGGGVTGNLLLHHHHHHHHMNNISINNNNDDTAAVVTSGSPRSSSVMAAARPSGHIKFSVAALLADTRPVRSPTPGSVYDDDMDTPEDDDDEDRNSVDVETTGDGNSRRGGRRCSSSTPDRGRSPMPLHPSPPLSSSSAAAAHHHHHQHNPFQPTGGVAAMQAARAAFMMSGGAAPGSGHHGGQHHPVAPVRPTPFTAFAAAAAAAYSAAGMQHPAAPGAWHPHYAGPFPAFGSAGLNSGSPGKCHSYLPLKPPENDTETMRLVFLIIKFTQVENVFT